MGKGYDPSMAAEICANAEGQRSEDETEESNEDEGWGYWLGGVSGKPFKGSTAESAR